jgi:cytochrome c-type biogenesis protein
VGHINIVASFLAGFFMFLAPCTLPILPGFIVFIGSDKKIVRNALFFCLGFLLTFLLFGLLAGLLGRFLLPYKILIQNVGAVFIIFFGLYTLQLFKLPIFEGQRVQDFFGRFLRKRFSPFIFGVSFACGWTPCVGPILASMFFYAAFYGTVFKAIVMFLIFSLGFVIPFLIIAFLVKRSKKALNLKSFRWFNIFAGLVLIFIGILLLTDNFSLLSIWGFKLFQFLNYQGINNLF